MSEKDTRVLAEAARIRDNDERRQAVREVVREERSKPKPTPGGPGGKIATKDIPKARMAYLEYRDGGGDLTWEDWLDKHWQN